MRRLSAALGLAGILLAAAAVHRGLAADPPPRIPGLFDPDHYTPKPDLSAIRTVRFLTTDDFPPFHWALADGTLVGFDIDLARAICRDLKLACTVQVRRFEALTAEIKAGHDDALIAAVANTPASRADLDFTEPYYTTPARFVTKQPSRLDAHGRVDAMTPAGLAKRVVGVEAGTAHEAYLRAFFPGVVLKAYRSQPDLRAALAADEVEAIFADGIGLAAWLNGPDSKECCAFRGGPFTESRFFGNGVSIAVAKGNVALRGELDYELAKLARDGIYAEIFLKYFPVSFY